MQKLVTVYLDKTAYGTPNAWGGDGHKHGFVEEHLQEYLTEGWHACSLFGLAGSSNNGR